CLCCRCNLPERGFAFNPFTHSNAERAGGFVGTCCALPYREYAPSGVYQCCHCEHVASLVLVEFLPPEIFITRRQLRKPAALMLMPEASMDEYRYFPTGH